MIADFRNYCDRRSKIDPRGVWTKSGVDTTNTPEAGTAADYTYIYTITGIVLYRT